MTLKGRAVLRNDALVNALKSYRRIERKVLSLRCSKVIHTTRVNKSYFVRPNHADGELWMGERNYADVGKMTACGV